MKAKLVFMTAVCASALSHTAFAQDFVPPKVVTASPGGVNLSDGSFMLSDTDLSIGPLALTRFHAGGARDAYSPPFGPRMSHNFYIYVAVNQRTTCSDAGGPGACTTERHPIVHIGNSASGQYRESTQAYSFSTVAIDDDDSMKGSLSRIGNGPYTYIDDSGNVYTFSAGGPAGAPSNSQKVDNIVYANGRRQQFYYDGSSRLKLVSDSSGYAIVFDYNSSGLIASSCGFNAAQTYISTSLTCSSAPIKASYTYTSGHLSSAVNAGLESNGYTWDADRIICVSQASLGCRIINAYVSPQGSWQVTQQNMADGSIWKYKYIGLYGNSRSPDRYVDAMSSNRAEVTDPSNNIQYYDFMETSPVYFTDSLGRKTTYAFYGGKNFYAPEDYPKNFGSILQSVTLPLGNKITLEHSAPRQAVSKETLTGINGDQVSQTYGYVSGCTDANSPKICAKPIWKRDTKGNQTDFTYTAFGAPESIMKPAAVSGQSRPLVRYDYSQRYAYILDSSNRLVRSNSPIWMIASQTDCQTVAGSDKSVCDGNAAIETVTYEYGADGTANNLLVRGIVTTSNGESRRTCYAYDLQGNRISETKPRASATTCP